MKKYHTIFIGGGINNLVCAALLAKKGKEVLVVERSEYLGGCIRSEKVENCVIDTLSTAYPLFVTSPAYAELQKDLENEGVIFVSNDSPTASVFSDKRFAILKTDTVENEKNFNSFSPGEGQRFRDQINWVGQNAELLFSFLSQELISLDIAKLLGKFVWKNGVVNSVQTMGSFMPNVRNDFPKYFKSNEVQAILAPWVLHTGLSPESPFSSTMAKIVAFTVEQVGLPMVKGGSYKIVDAFQNIIESKKGKCKTEIEVSKIIVNKNAKVEGIETNAGKSYYAENVVASVTPTQLYGRLLKDNTSIPAHVKKEAKDFKYGMGNIQIHLILNEAPKWYKEKLNTVTYVHLTDGINDVSRAVNEARRQVLPERATICIAQPSANDPSRAQDGKSVLWIQLPECPNFPKGDAANELNELCNGEWTVELKEAYANRILKRVEKYIPNINSACIYKDIISPKDLSQLNINLENGDPYGGLCEIEQYLAWRPLKSLKKHNTPIKNLYHSGASTHPGPGLGAGSGYLVAQQLLKK